MDEDRTIEALRDELGLEIERVLAIDPAPEVKSRVRARIAHDRASDARGQQWGLVAGGALTAAAVMWFALVLAPPGPLPAVATPIVQPVRAAPAVAGGSARIVV